MKRPELEFPLQWEYKIIAAHSSETYDAICGVVAEHGFSHTPRASNVSRNGKYITYSLCLHMTSREQLDGLTRAFAQCEGVKYLL
ncbi:MAG: DUF493 domain-containing protein [Deltaproteobacteria bacterium]|nr:DUF493 domain-containing protein [Deltaproteobacteria bacterium]